VKPEPNVVIKRSWYNKLVFGTYILGIVPLLLYCYRGLVVGT